MEFVKSLKQYILERYKSIREFCVKNDFPYSTIVNSITHGVMGSSVTLMIRLCHCLDLDVEEFCNGRLTPNNANPYAKLQLSLTPHEKALIIAYRARPDIQSGIDNILGITKSTSKEGNAGAFYLVRRAGRDGSNTEEYLTKEELEKLNSFPEATDL